MLFPSLLLSRKIILSTLFIRLFQSTIDFFLFYPLKAMLNTEYKSRLFRCLYQIQLDLKPFEASNILIRYPLTEIDHLIFSVACIDIKRRTSIHLFDSICFVCFFNCTIPENEKIVEISHHSLDEKKEKKEKM